MRFHVLGPVLVERDEERVPIQPGRQTRVLAVLLAHAGRRVPTSDLVEAAWGDAPPARARSDLSGVISRLRGKLGRSRISRQGAGYVIHIETGELDATEFENLVAHARTARDAGHGSDAIGLFDQALALWHGDPYDTGDDQQCPLLAGKARRLSDKRSLAVVDRAALLVSLGRAETTVPDLYDLLEQEPTHERAAGILIRALRSAGRQADACEVYRQVRASLRVELGAEPSPELEEPFQTLLRGDDNGDLEGMPYGAPALRNPDAASAGGDASTEARNAEQVVLVDGMPRPPKALQERSEQLDRLRAIGDRAESATICSLTGARGVGKTQLAAAYARDRIEDGWTVVWVDAESREHLVGGFAALADELGFPRIGQDSERAAARARRWLASRQRSGLLVLDNATDPHLAQEWIPSTGRTQVVVTSNHRTFGWFGEQIDVDVFSTEQARRLLSQITGSLPDEAADRLIEALGGLALALALAAAAITTEHLTYREYLERLAALPVGEALAAHGGDPYPRDVVEAVRLSLATVEEAEPAARSMAELIAVLSPTGVARTLLTGTDTDERCKAAQARILSHLTEVCLLTETRDGRSLLIHQLTARVVKERAVQDGTLPVAIAEATSRLHDRLGVIASDRTKRAEADDILGHIEALTSTTEECALDRRDRLALLELRGRGVQHLAETYSYQRIVRIGRAVLADQEQLLDADHIDILTTLHSLGFAHRALGPIDEAVALFKGALAGRERKLGADHPDTLRTRVNLACCRLAVGRPDLAIPQLERDLESQMEILGIEHPDTLFTHAALGRVNLAVGRTDVAIGLHEVGLAAAERAHGMDSLATIVLAGSLANCYRVAQRLDDALNAHRRHAAFARTELRPDQLQPTARKDHLAGMYRSLGRTEDSVALFEEALADREQIEGPDFAGTLATRNNLACANASAGRFHDARRLLERTADDLGRVLGRHHARTINALHNLASVHYLLGRLDRAIPLFECTLRARRDVLGQHLPDTLTTSHNLAIAYQSTDDHERGVELYNRTRSEERDVLGFELPDTTSTRNSCLYAEIHSVDETIRLPRPEWQDADDHMVTAP